MKSIHRFAAFAVASAFVLVPALFAADANAQAPVPGDARKWRADDVVRHGMESIRAQVAAMRDSSRLAPVQPRYYAAVGESIKRQVREMHARSTIGANADRSFHVVVNQLLIAAHALEGKTNSGPANALEDLELALAQYALLFEHPGWNS